MASGKKLRLKTRTNHMHAPTVPPLTGQEDRWIVALQRDGAYLLAFE